MKAKTKILIELERELLEEFDRLMKARAANRSKYIRKLNGG